MNNTKAYAAPSPKEALAPFSFQRREVQPNDVQIDILFCGVCHSDIHQARDEWGGSIYPMVPGHEIVGRVIKAGNGVTKFKVGELVGIGCFVDSCRECEQCQAGQEQYCEKGMSPTYNGYEQDHKTPTMGGYSTQIVVDEKYVLRVSPNLPLEGVAPLLCAGITTYSPLRHWNVGKGHKVGVLGLGGLGHMGVKIAAALGAEVTMLSTSPSKEADAKRLGAHRFALTTNPDVFKQYSRYFDFILDTVSASHDYEKYLDTLRTNGTLIMVGLPPDPMAIPAFSLVPRRRSVVGSMIGGIAETQEMLDFCAEHNITSDVEVIPIQQINEAYERTIKGQVKYRFVIDIASLKETNG
jgi:alcohol dehydrogenase (NADP+)